MDSEMDVQTAFSVRAARPTDYLGVAGLLAELLDRPELTEELGRALNTNLLRLLSNPGTTLLVAQTQSPEAELVGFVSLWTRWGLLDDAPSGLIDRLVVAKTWQGSAVPHALLEQALGACAAVGCASVEFVPAAGSLVPEAALAGFGFETVAAGRFDLELL